MTPTYAIKKGVRYRYYVSCVLKSGSDGRSRVVSAGRGGSRRAQAEQMVAQGRSVSAEFIVEAGRRALGAKYSAVPAKG